MGMPKTINRVGCIKNIIYGEKQEKRRTAIAKAVLQESRKSDIAFP
jgi:hypothetical protein